MGKAQGISLNVIIIAAIALIVLVVLVAIFTGRMGITIKSIESCTDKNGVCASYDSDETNAAAVCLARADDRTIPLPGTDCKPAGADDKAACCIAA